MWTRSSVTSSFPSWKSVIDSGMIGAGLTFSGGSLSANAVGGVTSIGGIAGAVSNAQIAAAATAGYGYTPASNALSVLTTAIVSVSAYDTGNATTGAKYLRFTRANTTFFDVLTSSWNYSVGG